MNNYTRMIGVMLILVYSLVFIFYILDRIFTNIIYFQGMLYTQIIGVPAFLFLNIVVILACIVMGSLTAYKQNEQLAWIKGQMQAVDFGEPLDDNEEMMMQPEIYELFQTIVKLNESVRTIKHQNQLVTTGVNEQIVKKIVEEERQRLARDLHDSVSQQLFAASMMLSAIKNHPLDEQPAKQVAILGKMLHEAQLEMRALLLHLRPLALQNKSLRAGIQDLISELKKKIPLTIRMDIADITMSKGVEDHLFRITQEAISNTLRHAHASQLAIELFQVGDSVILRLTDDGRGFDMSQRDESRYGINTMKERAVEIGGNCQIISAVKSGTRIEVKVPYTGGETS
ncbi:sensor histidine kinase [Macrococcus equipercicus]|uniref:Sensor histidine kinase n=1 Tax=Macrococcus equipercicus TaxID=69967 RepID=A0A9Q9BPP8_9STAP|nr:sensor histidine kinase [Macrococcus equipercicus]KAA1037684.1 sensor histidine kinase [Macrococcus equipercicus]UTH13396.1 sensor histidine kinase [Macrococcus equipercicus]